MKHLAAIAGLVSAMLLVGCGPVDLSRPPAIRLGEEACARCRMIISDERFAAALITPDGETLKFDDMGCLIQHESCGLRPATAYWIRDFGGSGWLNARDAVFVHSKTISSPMGFGLAAGRTAQAMGERTNEPGNRMLRFSELWGSPGASSSERPATTRSPDSRELQSIRPSAGEE
jgi:copper chaperone NosL